jgi:hypothetical protein
MHCQQKGFRYEDRGNFEDLFKRITSDNKDEEVVVDNVIKLKGCSNMGKKTINVNAQAFVIPNNAAMIKDYPNDTKKYLMDFAVLNNVELHNDDKIVQLWFASKELGSDNIADHGFKTMIDDFKIEVHPYKLQFVPAKMLAGLKEGQTINFLAPCYTAHAEKLNENLQCDVFEVTLNVTMTCKQKGFRYESCGNFEEAVEGVIKDMKECKPVDVTEKEKEKGNNKMKNYIAETWNKLPQGVKTGIKVVGAVAAVAAVGYVGNEVYKKYNQEDEIIVIDMVVSDEDSDILEITDDGDIVDVED